MNIVNDLPCCELMATELESMLFCSGALTCLQTIGKRLELGRGGAGRGGDLRRYHGSRVRAGPKRSGSPAQKACNFVASRAGWM